MSNKCPACNSQLYISQPVEINQPVVCSNCGMELEVVWLYPLELARVSGPALDESRTAKSAGADKSKTKLGKVYPTSD